MTSEPGIDAVSTPLSQTRIAFLAIAVAIVSAIAGFSLWQVTQARPPVAYGALVVLPEPRSVPAFTLQDQDAKPFTATNLEGHWSLLFFGFTHCPDVCPSTLFDLARLEEALRAAPQVDRPAHQVVFVSVDPERDTPDRLKDYIEYFDPGFIAVTGPHEELEPLTRKLGIAYRIGDHAPGNARYEVDHSAAILLLDPQGRLHGVFPAPHDPDVLLADFQTLLDAEAGS
jgi:protein SCO1/2